MTAIQEATAASHKHLVAAKEPESGAAEIDRDALAGSGDSLGAQSVRDGRPATDDDVVEAMDEEGPGIDDLNGK